MLTNGSIKCLYNTLKIVAREKTAYLLKVRNHCVFLQLPDPFFFFFFKQGERTSLLLTNGKVSEVTEYSLIPLDTHIFPVILLELNFWFSSVVPLVLLSVALFGGQIALTCFAVMYSKHA